MTAVFFSHDMISLYSEKIKNMVLFKKGWQIIKNITEKDIPDIENYSMFSSIHIFADDNIGELFYLERKVNEMEKNGYKFYFGNEYKKLKNKLEKKKKETPEYFV